MDLSFSELKDLVFNACMGSNLPTGVCEDLSFGVTFLESRSLAGSKELLIGLASNYTGVSFSFFLKNICKSSKDEIFEPSL